jgi:sulfur relay (sulfurtransferase) complex TusBCD TusD component (DsrE family)
MQMSKAVTILLCDSPFQHESVDHAVEIARASLRKGHGVNIYLMMDGVYAPNPGQNGEPFKTRSISERLVGLIEEGARVSTCRVCSEIRGVGDGWMPEGVDVGGIFDLSEMIAESDVFLSFSRGR